MYTVCHVDKYKITFKLVINLTNEILYHIVVSTGLSRSGIIDDRAWYRAAARRLISTALKDQMTLAFSYACIFVDRIRFQDVDNLMPQFDRLHNQ